jgi:hypothetical protein
MHSSSLILKFSAACGPVLRIPSRVIAIRINRNTEHVTANSLPVSGILQPYGRLP